MTIARTALVEFWPLVDIGRLDVREGDLVIVRAPAIVNDPLLRKHFAEVWERTFPGVAYAVAGDMDFAVKRPMPEMRAEDLEQPERKGTMA
jgi:hypothetical protein